MKATGAQKTVGRVFGRDVKNYVHPIITIGESMFIHHSTILILSVERTQGSFDGSEKVNRFEPNKGYYDNNTAQNKT